MNAPPSPDALRAWLEGRGPCPWPGERETDALRRGAEVLLTMPANELADLMADNPTDSTPEDAIAFIEGRDDGARWLK